MCPECKVFGCKREMRCWLCYCAIEYIDLSKSISCSVSLSMNAIYDILLLRFMGFIGSVLYIDNLTIKIDSIHAIAAVKSNRTNIKAKRFPVFPIEPCLGISTIAIGKISYDVSFISHSIWRIASHMLDRERKSSVNRYFLCWIMQTVSFVMKYVPRRCLYCSVRVAS